MSPIFSTRQIKIIKNKKTVNAPREVQAVNVHNIPHYIHVIPECTPWDAVSNLCDRFRWTLVKGALRGESSLGLTQAASTRSPGLLTAEPRPVQPTATDSRARTWHHCHLLTTATHNSLCLHHTLELYTEFRDIAFAKRLTKTQSKVINLECNNGHGRQIKKLYINRANYLQTDLVYTLNGTHNL